MARQREVRRRMLERDSAGIWDRSRQERRHLPEIHRIQSVLGERRVKKFAGRHYYTCNSPKHVMFDLGRNQIDVPRQTLNRNARGKWHRDNTTWSLQTFQLRAHIFQGRFDPGMDASGLLDSFIRVAFQGYTASTQVSQTFRMEHALFQFFKCEFLNGIQLARLVPRRSISVIMPHAYTLRIPWNFCGVYSYDISLETRESNHRCNTSVINVARATFRSVSCYVVDNY